MPALTGFAIIVPVLSWITRRALPLGLLMAALPAPALAASAPYETPGASNPAAPTPLKAPSVTGTATIGGTLTGNRGSWPPGTSLSSQWLRCSPSARTCETTGDADTSYAVTAVDAGATMIFRVVAGNAVGTRTADAVSNPIPVPPAATLPEAEQPATSLKRLSPFPSILVGGRVAGSVTRITTVRLRHVPGGATINIACKGRRCPFRKHKTRVRKGKSRSVRLSRLQRRMRAGTVIVITVRKGNTLGKYVRLRLRKRLAPARVDRCVKPKVPRPIRCP